MSFPWNLWADWTDIKSLAIPQGFSWGIAFLVRFLNKSKNCLKNWKF
jgi:hypothetical protein